MTVEKSTTITKVDEIIVEMKEHDLWNHTEPAWVKNYEANKGLVHDDFAEWLQFVYLPNCAQSRPAADPSIVPQARKYFGDDLRKGKLLELLVELDALI